ncbi:hypothetical protein BPC006_II3096 [Burkholderia pseudomallei BPC006]|nr:hypothetical protein BPC006_II3096 [Burkholderia pseudomallei BPC006]EEH24686.1 hypothetical protein BUH_7553 [Burkholderia pseudomallei Pakistan 9]
MHGNRRTEAARCADSFATARQSGVPRANIDFQSVNSRYLTNSVATLTFASSRRRAMSCIFDA